MIGGAFCFSKIIVPCKIVGESVQLMCLGEFAALLQQTVNQMLDNLSIPKDGNQHPIFEEID